MSHSLFIQSSTQEFRGDSQTLLVNGVAFEHPCASCFSKVVAPIYTHTGNISKSPQITSSAVFEIIMFENFFQVN